MTARTHARTSYATMAAPTRLPWWGLALPVLGFVVLLSLLVTGGQSRTDSSALVAVSQIVEHFQRAAGG